MPNRKAVVEGCRIPPTRHGFCLSGGMQVKQLMHPHPVSVQCRQTIAAAARLLEQLDVRHLPVLDGTRLVGMLSDRDFREVLPDGLEIEAPREIADRQVSTITASEVISVTPDADISEAVDLIVGRKIGALPVVEEGHVLVGILTYTDLLQEIRNRVS